MFPSNGSDCEDDVYNPSIVICAVQTSLYNINFVLATCIIIPHLCCKELQTVSGMLLILLCFFFNVENIITFIQNRFQFTHKINDNGEVCATFIWVKGILNLLSQFTTVTILLQFAYLMYNAYRVRSFTDSKSILKYYLIFIITMTTIHASIAITCRCD